jgi:hypothetical protein
MPTNNICQDNPYKFIYLANILYFNFAPVEHISIGLFYLSHLKHQMDVTSFSNHRK